MMNKIKNKEAQALVILLIFLAISLVIVTSASFSAIKATETVRRNINYQSSFDQAESLIDQMALQVDSGDTTTISDIKDGLGRLLGKVSVNYIFNTQVKIPLDQGVNIDIAEQRTKTPGGINAGATAKLYCAPVVGSSAIEVTEVFKQGSIYYEQKFIYRCSNSSINAIGGTLSGTDANFLTLNDAGGYYVSVPLVTNSSINYYQNPNIQNPNIPNLGSGELQLVRLRSLVNDSTATLTVSYAGVVVAGTSKYVIVASGLTGDGSASSTISVEKPGGFYQPNILDYVFFQGQ